MRRRLSTMWCGALMIGFWLVSYGLPSAQTSSLLIRGGTLIDGTGRPPLPDARILIVGNTIQRVWSGDAGAPQVPADAQVVDAAGKFIIPGLIDSHTHYNWYMGELFLSHGVTTICDLGGQLLWQLAMQKGLNSGKLRGPTYYHGTTLGGGLVGAPNPGAGANPGSVRWRPFVGKPEDAAQAVAALKGKADVLVLNENWTGEYFTAAAREAHAAGLHVISHSYNAIDSATWGVDGIEHMTGVGMAAIRSPEGRKAMAALTIEAGHKNSLLYQWMEPAYFDEMIRHLVGEGVFLNPTLDFEWKGIIDRTPEFEREDQRLLFNPLLQYVPMDERLVTLGQYHWADKRPAADRQQFLKGYRNVQEFLRRFVAAGGKLYSGTDSAAANTPGLALHHEMQLLVDAGVPPMKALMASTKWAAEMLRVDARIGTIEPTKAGDVVILRDDPLADIHNTQSIERVIKGGEVVDITYHSDFEVPFHQYGPVSKHLYNQPPHVQEVDPGFAIQGKEAKVRVRGTNFVPNSVVLFRGAPVATQWVSATELTAILTPKETSAVGNYLVGVQTPKPGGGTSAEEIGFIVDYP